MERLTSIRENKQKILQVLRGLQENRKEDEVKSYNLEIVRNYFRTFLISSL